VGVAVGPAGVAVGVFVRVLVGVTVEVGVGVAPRVTVTIAEARLFPMKGSASLPMTPTTAVSTPCDCGTTRITRLLRPAAAQVTVVDNSAEAVLAEQIPAGTDESSETLGKNTAVTVTLAAPLAPPIPTVKAAALPTVAPAGAATPTDRSRCDCPRTSSETIPATTAKNPFFQNAITPLIGPPLDPPPFRPTPDTPRTLPPGGHKK
jgi:hypothetical protein